MKSSPEWAKALELSEETTSMLLEKASKTLEKGVEFDIINIQTAA